MRNRITIAEAEAQLKTQKNQLFTTLFRHGSLEIEYYKPDKVDLWVSLPH